MTVFEGITKQLIGALLLVVAFAAVSIAQDKESYVLAVKNDLSSSQNVQARKIFSDALEVLMGSLGVEIELVDYSSDEEIIKAMEERSADFIFVTTTAFYLGMLEHGYRPFASASMFGSKDTKLCIYSTSDKQYDSIESIRGLEAYTYKDQYEYFALYDLVGEPPEDFFGSLKISPNGQSMVYALAMGDVDVAFFQSSNILFFKTTNPGAVKNIKEVVCSNPYYSNALMVHEDIPDSFVKKVQDAMDEVPQHDAFKQYKPMIKMFQWKNLRVTLEDYREKLDLFEAAMEKGWDENYHDWLLYAGGND